MRVSEEIDVVGSNGSPQRKLKVAVAGCGVVGEGAVLKLLERKHDTEIVGILVRNSTKTRSELIDRNLFTTSQDEFLDQAPDVVIDALSSGEEGLKLTQAALAKGVSVVSANKQALAGKLKSLHALREKTGARLDYSPSVGGGAPIIEAVREAASLGRIKSIDAILNGTVNYVLTSLSAGADFQEAILKAQDAGFAEADPSADLDGFDAAAKARILIFEAIGVELDAKEISVEPLDETRASHISDNGGVWRQMVHIDFGEEISASVSIRQVKEAGLFARTLWEGNALRATLSNGETIQCCGRGAGRGPTVKSALNDLEAFRRVKPGAPS